MYKRENTNTARSIDIVNIFPITLDKNVNIIVPKGTVNVLA
ncbi:hypothetical protein [uncultured Sneathia sp.]|nr:hypothetical protein [uncultured Sneathia sp.]